MNIKVTMTIEVTDEIGRHLGTATISDYKDVGGNPRFYLAEAGYVTRDVAERALVTSAQAIDKTRALANN